jgi:hypothetical protein
LHRRRLLQKVGLLQGCLQLLFVEVYQNGAVDVEGGGGYIAVSPQAHLVGRAGGVGYVDLPVRQVARSQPGAGLLARRAPIVAVHDDPPMWQIDLFYRFYRRSSGCGRRRLRIDPAQFGQQNFVVGLVVDVVDVNISDNAILVDEKQRPLRTSFLGTQNSVLRGNRAMGPKVAQERIADTSQAFRPGGQTGNVIYADAQNLGIRFRELGLIGLVSRNLARSDRGPGHGEEGQDDVVAPQLTQRHFLAKVTGKREIRGLLSYFQTHWLPPIQPTRFIALV